MSVIDFAQARWEAAKDCGDVSTRDMLVEALRRLDAGEFCPGSAILIGLHSTDDGVSWLEIMHGGPANTNERLGAYARATHLSLSTMNGDA